MLSKVHYTKSKHNKDDDGEHHQSYTCPRNPGRHRFIVVVMGHHSNTGTTGGFHSSRTAFITCLGTP